MLCMKIGIDIVEIDRIKKSASKPRFLSRIFSPQELKFLMERNFSTQVIAGNFCANEAFAKALGTGFRGFSFNEISVLRDYMGSPYISLSGGAKRAVDNYGKCEIEVSISHSRENAVAVVTITRK